MRLAPTSLILSSIVAVFVLTTGACRRDTPNAGVVAEVSVQPSAAPSAPSGPSFAEQIRAAIRGYHWFTRVDNKPHWAPGPCSPMDAPEDPSQIRLSSAGPESLHAEKLYYLYAKNYKSYLKPAEGSAPVGQVIVKQGYLARELAKDDKTERDVLEVAERNGHKYITGDPLALFIMMKVDEKTPNTDHGWIYGIADFNGEVKSGGVIQACANCHANAPHDRLFGPIHE